MKKKYGLIGYPLTHSFSPSYFAKKFSHEQIQNCEYYAYELNDFEDQFEALLNLPGLHGLNVTIPFKEKVIPFLDRLDKDAKDIKAVNTIKFVDGKTIGFNTDVYGFEQSLRKFIKKQKGMKALVLGTGGAAKAVGFVLKKMRIPHQFVSRSGKHTSYEAARTLIASHHLLINTTPLGMSPKINACADINYDGLGKDHFLYDLIYNPEKTLFLKKGEEKGAKIKNGHDMLILQAEKSWSIWNS